MAKKILLVEDEKSIAEGIIYNLKNEGMRVTHVDEGPIALDLFEEEHFDLVILDIMLPEISGLDICRSIRKTSNVPIIMVTARDDEVDKITGLEIGADDYITKPFSVKELISRVKAVMRRAQFSTPTNASQKTGLFCSVLSPLSLIIKHSKSSKDYTFLTFSISDIN